MSARDLIHPVILSGGMGTRLWPLSRQTYPKQLLPLVGKLSPLQETANRLKGDDTFAPPLVVANHEHRFVIAEQLRQIGVTPPALLLEPVGRNTAAAAGIAALAASEADPEAVIALLPADHTIAEPGALREGLRAGLPAAMAGRLVTFGVVPSRPETGYGYIERGQPISGAGIAEAVVRFVEKPDAATAEAYLADGRHHWNSGMFLLRADVLLAEMERLAPAVLDACRKALAAARLDGPFRWLDADAFEASPNISIDYAVMEKTDRAAVVPVGFSWNDIGAWHALWDLEAKDEQGNVALGPVRTRDSRNSYLRSEDGRLLVGLGLEDMIVVSTRDALLVAPRSQAPAVGKMVESLRNEGRPEVRDPPVVHRPWGTYEDLVEGPFFRVKRIVVKPQQKLSLQYHHHRAEHWVVVQGTAEVTRGGEDIILGPNESVFIPRMERHRLFNPGTIPLVLIEVQCGEYVGENDIVRLTDTYGRAPQG